MTLRKSCMGIKDKLFVSGMRITISFIQVCLQREFMECFEYSLEGLMLKLKHQYFGHLMRRTDSLKKTLILRKTEDRRRGQQSMRWLDSIINSMDVSLHKLREIVKDRESWCTAVHRIRKSWTLPSD